MNTDVLLTLSVAAAKSVILLLAGLLACAWLRRSSAALRHLVWTLVMGAALIVPATSLLVPGIAVLPNWPRPTNGVREGESAAASIVADSHEATSAARSALTSTAPVSSSQELMSGSLSLAAGLSDDDRLGRLASVIGWLWLAGVAICLLPLAVGHWIMRRLALRYPAVRDDALTQAVRAVAAEVTVRPPPLHIGPAGIMPLVWGLGRGHLLLPAEAATWDALRLRAVLLHELAHLRRRDVLSMVVGQIARAVYWFNPLAWLAVSRMRIERERACDDYVLRGGIAPSEFATTVLELAISRRMAGASSAALAMSVPSRIESRLQTILAPVQDRRGVTHRTVAIAGGLTCAMLSIVRAGNETDRKIESPPAVAAMDEQREEPRKEETASTPAEKQTPNFLIFPVTTELQRHLVNHGPGKRSDDVKAYVLLNGMSVITPDGKLDESALGLDAIRTGLEPYADRERGIAHFHVYYDLVTPDRESKNRLVSVLQEFGRDAGFKIARVSNSYQGEGFDWETMLEEVNANSETADLNDGPIGIIGVGVGSSSGVVGTIVLDQEPKRGNDRVQVYPVQTRLSRILSGNSDCVIDYVTPIEKAADVPFPRVDEASIKFFVARLDLKQTRKLLIRVTSTGDEGREAVDRLVEIARERLDEELGFDLISISNTPQ